MQCPNFPLRSQQIDQHFQEALTRFPWNGVWVFQSIWKKKNFKKKYATSINIQHTIHQFYLLTWYNIWKLQIQKKNKHHKTSFTWKFKTLDLKKNLNWLERISTTKVIALNILEASLRATKTLTNSWQNGIKEKYLSDSNSQISGD